MSGIVPRGTHMNVITVLTGQSTHLSLLPAFTFFQRRRVLNKWVQSCEIRGYRHPVAFTVHNHIAAPDDEHWKSGQGILVQEHLWFFEKPMTRSWAYDIATGFQGNDAWYLGVYVRYRRHRPDSTVVVGAHYRPEQITTWLHLFSPKYEMRSTAHIYTRLQNLLET